MLRPGTRIGPYTVEAELGTGATAVVYRVRHDQLATRRALKVLSLSHPQVRERMLREGRLQARLKHPHIVRVLDTVDVDGSLGLLMEYVDGVTLDQWLLQHRDAPMHVRDALVRQIVEAVAHAHAEGLIHRDLKPANVLVADTEDGPSARVTDFGLAKVLDTGAPSTHDTRTGLALGTPRYMSPEQMRSAKHVDARADVFSLGCVLYEVYCGRPAFPQQDMLDVFNAVSDGIYDDPGEVGVDVPRPALAAMRAALQHDPARRPADACELLVILDTLPLGLDTDTTTMPLGDDVREALLAPDALESPSGSSAQTVPMSRPVPRSRLAPEPLGGDPGATQWLEDEAEPSESGSEEGLPVVAFVVAGLGATVAFGAIATLLMLLAIGVLYWMTPGAEPPAPVEIAPPTAPSDDPLATPPREKPAPGSIPRARPAEPRPSPAPPDDGDDRKGKKDKDKDKRGRGRDDAPGHSR